MKLRIAAQPARDDSPHLSAGLATGRFTRRRRNLNPVRPSGTASVACDSPVAGEHAGTVVGGHRPVRATPATTTTNWRDGLGRACAADRAWGACRPPVEATTETHGDHSSGTFPRTAHARGHPQRVATLSARRPAGTQRSGAQTTGCTDRRSVLCGRISAAVACGASVIGEHGGALQGGHCPVRAAPLTTTAGRRDGLGSARAAGRTWAARRRRIEATAETLGDHSRGTLPRTAHALGRLVRVSTLSTRRPTKTPGTSAQATGCIDRRSVLCGRIASAVADLFLGRRGAGSSHHETEACKDLTASVRAGCQPS